MKLKDFSIFILILLAAIVIDSGFLFSSMAIDFPSFYFASINLIEGISIYDIDGIRELSNFNDHIYPYIYTPVLAQFLSIFSFLSYESALIYWRILSLILFALSTFKLLSLFRNEGKISPLWFEILIVIITIALSAQRYIIYSGQIDLIVLSLIILSFYNYRKTNEYTSSLLLAIAILLKLFPIFLLVYFLFKDYRITLISVGWMATFIAISFLIFGVGPWYEYFEIVKLSSQDPEFLGIASITNEFNSSLLAFLSSIISNPKISKIISIFAFAFLFLIGSSRLKVRSGLYKDIFDLNLIMVLMIMWSPYLWRQHFIYIFVGLFTLMIMLKKDVSFKNLIGIYLFMISATLLSYDYVKILAFFKINLPRDIYGDVNFFLLLFILVLSVAFSFYKTKDPIDYKTGSNLYQETSTTSSTTNNNSSSVS